MQYVSPFSIIQVTPSATGFDRKDLMLAKRKMLAEFEFSDSATISVKGRAYTKNDVLQLFEDLEKAEDLQHHIKVATDPVLLRFLEKHTIGFQQRFLLNKQQLDWDFIAWISPYFATAFSQAAYTYFKEQKLVELRTLLFNETLMTENDAYKAWNKTEGHLQKLIHDITQLHEGGVIQSDRINACTDSYTIELINALPGWRFADRRNDYAFELMQLSIMVFNQQDKTWGLEILAVAQTLQVDEETAWTLREKQQEMEDIVAKRSSRNQYGYERDKHKKDSDGSNFWPIIRVLAIVLFIVFRMMSSNNSSNNSISNMTSATVTVRDDYSRLYQESEIRLHYQFALDTALESMLHAIQTHAGNESGKATASTARLKTGTDPYKKLWDKPAFTITNGETVAMGTEVITKDAYKRAAGQKDTVRYKVDIQNNSGIDAIVFAVTRTGLVSRFVARYTNYTLNLPAGYAKLYIYAGDGFDVNEHTAFKVSTGNKQRLTVPGLFTTNTAANVYWLGTPFYLACKDIGGNNNAAKLFINENIQYANQGKVEIEFANNASNIENQQVSSTTVSEYYH